MRMHKFGPALVGVLDGASASPYADRMARSHALVRPRRRLIGGVCAALADRFGTSATVVRILFVASCLLPGPQILLYLALWIILPSE